MQRGALDKFVVGSRPSKERIDECKPPLPHGIVFETPEHIKAIDQIIYQGRCCCLTGEAGAGKSELTKYLYKWLSNIYGESTVHVTATYGTAAANMEIPGAQTFHSLMGIQLGTKRMADGTMKMITPDEAFNRVKKLKADVLTQANVIIIDEISALGGNFFTLCDQYMQRLRRQKGVFMGGVLVVVVGDFSQIPPINDINVFERESWVKNFNRSNIVYLKSNYRQNGDDAYLSLLQDLRTGVLQYKKFTLTKENAKVFCSLAKPLEERPDYDPTQIVVKIVATREEAKQINDMELAKLPEPEISFVATSDGDENIISLWRKNLLCAERFSLRIGARVMLTKNLDVPSGLVNGAAGRVTSMSPDGTSATIFFPSLGMSFPVGTYTWKEIDLFGTCTASYTQVPLMLAYATTVEKSQGMTLPRVKIDFARMFNHGEVARKVYVAMSRVRRLEHMQLVNIDSIDWTKMLQDAKVAKYTKAIK